METVELVAKFSAALDVAQLSRPIRKPMATD